MTDKVKNFSVRLPSQTDNLELIRNFVGGVARKVGLPQTEVSQIELAVDEACTNVIEHAYRHSDDQTIDVAIKIDYRKFTVVVTDKGQTFSPEDVEMPDMKKYLAELRVGGLGIYLMKTLMDEVQYESRPGRGNQVRMVKYLMTPGQKKKKTNKKVS